MRPWPAGHPTGFPRMTNPAQPAPAGYIQPFQRSSR